MFFDSGPLNDNGDDDGDDDGDDGDNDDNCLEELTVLRLSLPYEFPHGDGNHY